MITSTTRPDRPGRRAFTLVEVMIAASLGSMVLAGVLSTFLMLARSGASAVNYTTMDIQVRRALQEFGQDIRMASNIAWNSSSSITLTVPNNYTTTSNQVTYSWDNTSASSPSYRCFYRVPGNSTATTPKTIFVRNVTSLVYSRYNRTNAPATTEASTKRVQIAMTVTATTQTVVAATDQMVAASFILRNKIAN